MGNFKRFEGLYNECISWIDDDFSSKTREEREVVYESYRWMFTSDCEHLPSLEPLISDARIKYFREKFKEWFYVVCDYALDPQHLGKTPYSRFLNHPYWKGKKSKGNTVYIQRVILTLGMMGIFTGIKIDYLHLDDKAKSHCREYYVDCDKLTQWTTTTSGEPVEFGTSSWTSLEPPALVSSFSDDDFDFSFLEREDDKSWTLHNDWFAWRQKETISSLEVIPVCFEKAECFLKTFPYKTVNALSREKKKQFIRIYRNSKCLVNLHNGEVGGCKVDDKGGRMYTMMVGMAKEFRRNCVLLDGERIVEVDVSSSQPTLLGLKVKKDTGKTTQWLSRCLSGDFYQWVKRLTGTKVKRDRVKKYVMRFLFSCYRPDLPKDYEGEHLPQDNHEYKKGYRRFEQKLISYLKENEPEVFAMVDSYKRNPVWSDKVWIDSFEKPHQGRWCSSLPVEMQKVEVEYIKTCLASLPEGMKFYTIHDAICVKESDGRRVKETMESVSLEMYGEKIAVKIENSLS